MEDLIELTVARLKDKSDGALPWRDVKELDDLSELDKVRSNRMPCLYVFEVSESPKPDVRGTGPYLQSCQTTIGVAIVNQSTNGKRMSWTELRKALRKKLFGWTPAQGYEPYWLGSGKLIGVAGSTATWHDNFITEYDEDQRNYVS